MLRRAQEERQEWLPAGEVEAVEHDNLEDQEVEEVSDTKYQNYFSAPRYYYMKTICAPCGVVLAWHKFAKAEGVAKILKFLEDVYPDSASCSSYIAIDKGCALLKHIVRQAPLNGDAPNLVVVANDNQGNPYYKRAFNTQACEQLNAWIGGFQTVLNQMTISNFDFTMHVLLFIHTQQVIAKQEEKKRKQEAGIEVVESDEESEDEEDSESEEESEEEEN
ncbi:hypothetical protein BDN71DRAFT_1514096 [Pleurotus eryngii]|uniref:Uncharacterized protein n=1 Tax=Pleurotus eryngii TaxID=5323 RepID=A0A9P5ZFX0_PLEER|nr:hypothetical protein BDN71DRAFT_1514096 [Pleurotus eryngii]